MDWQRNESTIERYAYVWTRGKKHETSVTYTNGHSTIQTINPNESNVNQTHEIYLGIE